MSFEQRVQIPDDRRLYVIGDIHGHGVEFDELLAKIREDIAKQNGKPCGIVLLGDPVNRDPENKRVIDTILRLHKGDGLCANTVLYDMDSNHMRLVSGLVSEIDYDQAATYVYNMILNGGATTFASYGIFLNGAPSIRQSSEEAKNALKAYVRLNADVIRTLFLQAAGQEHCDYFSAPKLFSLENSHFFICHGGVDPTKPLAQQDEAVLVGVDYKEGISRAFLKYASGLIGGKTIVHGHSITSNKMVEKEAGRISVDTGCYDDGRLSCVILDEGKMEGSFFVPSKYSRSLQSIPIQTDWPPRQKNIFDFLL